MEKLTNDNVHVVIRVRPLISSEKNSSSDNAVHWRVQETSIFQVDGVKKSMCTPYVFDRIFDENSTSEQIFNEVAGPILDAVMEGYNGTIFAYGQTCSGKTYTMMGNGRDLGIIPRMAMELFCSIQMNPTRTYLLRVSCMEIYNENVYDLLSCKRKPLSVHEDQGQTFVKGLTEKIVNNCNDLLDIIKQAEGNRSYGATVSNEYSSRSHTIYRVIIESSAWLDLDEDEGLMSEQDGVNVSAVTVSHLNLVDLAGSERAGQCGSTGDRFKEGCAINNSLFFLRNVISKLSQGDTQYINYRDSKLTRILQSSLGGNAKTSIICTVTPAVVDETHSTLKFARTAKTVRNKPQINEVLSDEVLLKRSVRDAQDLQKKLKAQEQLSNCYAKEIQMLKEQLESSRDAGKEEKIKEMELLLQEENIQKQQMAEKLKTLKNSIITAFRHPIVDLATRSRRETWGGNIGFKDLQLPNETFDFARSAFPERKLPARVTFADQPPLPASEPQADILKMSDEIKSLSKIIDSLKFENLELKTQHKKEKDMFEREKAAFQQALAMQSFCSLEADILTEAEEKLTLAQKQNADLRQSVADLNERLMEANKKENPLASELDDLKQQMHAMANARKDLQMDVDNCKTHHLPLMATNEELQKDLVNTKEKITYLENQIRDIDVQRESQCKHFETVKKELRTELKSAYDTIRVLQRSSVDVVQRETADKGVSTSFGDAAAVASDISFDNDTSLISATDLEKGGAECTFGQMHLTCHHEVMLQESRKEVAKLTAELQQRACAAEQLERLQAEIQQQRTGLEVHRRQTEKLTEELEQSKFALRELDGLREEVQQHRLCAEKEKDLQAQVDELRLKVQVPPADPLQYDKGQSAAASVDQDLLQQLITREDKELELTRALRQARNDQKMKEKEFQKLLAKRDSVEDGLRQEIHKGILEIKMLDNCIRELQEREQRLESALKSKEGKGNGMRQFQGAKASAALMLQVTSCGTQSERIQVACKEVQCEDTVTRRTSQLVQCELISAFDSSSKVFIETDDGIATPGGVSGLTNSVISSKGESEMPSSGVHQNLSLLGASGQITVSPESTAVIDRAGRDENSNTESACMYWKERCQSLESELELSKATLEERISVSRGRKTKTDPNIEKLEADLEKVKNDLVLANNEIEHVHKKNENLKLELRCRTSEFHSTAYDNAEERKKLREQILFLESEMHTTENKCKKLQSEIRSLQLEKDTSYLKPKAVKDEVIKEQHAEASNWIPAASGGIVTRINVEHLQQEVRRLKKRVQSLERENVRLKVSVNRQQEKISVHSTGKENTELRYKLHLKRSDAGSPVNDKESASLANTGKILDKDVLPQIKSPPEETSLQCLPEWLRSNNETREQINDGNSAAQLSDAEEYRQSLEKNCQDCEGHPEYPYHKFQAWNAWKSMESSHKHISSGKPRISIAWKYFRMDGEDKSKVVCQVCGERLKFSGSTTSMKYHLRRHTPDISLDVSLPLTSQSSGKSTNANSAASRQDAITSSLVAMCIIDMQPSSIVNRVGFKNLLQFLEPNYTLPSRQSLNRRIAVHYELCKYKSLSELQQCADVALTVERWTGAQNTPFVTIAVYYVSADWELQRRVLNTTIIPENPSEEHLAEHILTTVRTFGIQESSVVASVHESDSAAIPLTYSSLNWQYFPCFAGTLSQCVMVALRLPEVAKLIEACHTLVDCILSCSAHIGNNTMKEKEGGFIPHMILKDHDGHWSSTFHMMDSIYEQQLSLKSLLKMVTSEMNSTSTNCDSGKCSMFTSEMGWQLLGAVVEALRPLDTVREMLSGEPHVTLSTMVPVLFSLVNVHLRDVAGDGDVVKKLKQAVMREMKLQFNFDSVTFSESFGIMASVLDPRHKSLPFINEVHRTVIKGKLTSLVEEMRVNAVSNSGKTVCGDGTSVPTPVVNFHKESATEKTYGEGVCSPKRAKVTVAEFLSSVYLETGADGLPLISQGRFDEVEAYLQEMPASLSSNPLSWWKSNCSSYPNLSRLARRMLCIPATAMSPAQAFCRHSGGSIKRQRASLNPKIVDKVLFLNGNFTTNDLTLEEGETSLRHNLVCPTQPSLVDCSRTIIP